MIQLVFLAYTASQVRRTDGSETALPSIVHAPATRTQVANAIDTFKRIFPLESYAAHGQRGSRHMSTTGATIVSTASL